MNRQLFFSAFFFSTLVLFSSFTASADQLKEKPSKAQKLSGRPPIETKMDIGFLGIIGSGMTYSMEGKNIQSTAEFKKIIDPMGDPEASHLIHEAAEAEFAWWVLAVGGVVSGLDVALLYKPVPFVNIDFIDRIASGAVALQIFLAPGIIFGTIASSDKYNAVQRYNHLAEGKETVSLNLYPQLFASQGHLGLGMGCAF